MTLQDEDVIAFRNVGNIQRHRATAQNIWIKKKTRYEQKVEILSMLKFLVPKGTKWILRVAYSVFFFKYPRLAGYKTLVAKPETKEII